MRIAIAPQRAAISLVQAIAADIYVVEIFIFKNKYYFCSWNKQKTFFTHHRNM